MAAIGVPITYTCNPYTPGYAAEDHVCTWTFDDSTTQVGASVSKTWSMAGAHVATVTVVCTPTGTTGTAQCTVAIAVPIKLDITDAILAWNGEVPSPGTTATVYDWTGHGYLGKSDTDAVLSDWFTTTSTYKTSPGGSPTVLGRNLVSLDDANAGGARNGIATGLVVPNSAVSASPLIVDASVEWGMTLSVVLIRGANPPTNGCLVTFYPVDPTHFPGKTLNIWVNINTAGDTLSFQLGPQAIIGSIQLNGSDHLWDTPGQAILLTISLHGVIPSYSQESLVDIGWYVNGVSKATNSYWLTIEDEPNIGKLQIASDLHFNDSRIAIADTVLFGRTLLESEIVAQAEAWGLYVNP